MCRKQFALRPELHCLVAPYPGRNKVFGAHGPNGKGLDPKFATIAEQLKKVDYATAHFGKWHCGDTPEATHPLARGFDEHAGHHVFK